MILVICLVQGRIHLPDHRCLYLPRPLALGPAKPKVLPLPIREPSIVREHKDWPIAPSLDLPALALPQQRSEGQPESAASCIPAQVLPADPGPQPRLRARAFGSNADVEELKLLPAMPWAVDPGKLPWFHPPGVQTGSSWNPTLPLGAMGFINGKRRSAQLPNYLVGRAQQRQCGVEPAPGLEPPGFRLCAQGPRRGAIARTIAQPGSIIRICC
jgi:hypothetical protein